MRSYVLMTALPPTLGHLDLIRFAASLGGEVVVIVTTQPDEPYYYQRYRAIKAASDKLNLGVKIIVEHFHKTLPQEPEGQEGFWPMWGDILAKFGFMPGDRIVASELYGVRLAEEVGGQFYPYDLDRWIRYTKATQVRENWLNNWDQILPEFRKNIQLKVTLFGAESTGKTTLTKALAGQFSPHANKIFEWARPYLEAVGPELTTRKMTAIMEGQYALQQTAYETAVKPILFQDTDLFSTIGYWKHWSPDTFPRALHDYAQATRSDIYIMPQANIPFEHDMLRYGGDERELTDLFWVDILEEYELPYVVLNSADHDERVSQAKSVVNSYIMDNPVQYQRKGAEYEQGD